MNKQSTWKEILINKERMNFEEEVYYSYDRNLQNEEEDKE